MVGREAPPRRVMKNRNFDPDLNHWFIDAAKHGTSPLSVAMFVFALAKYNMRSQFFAWKTAREVLRTYRRAPPSAPASAAGSTGAGGAAGGGSSANVAQQRRAYSTRASSAATAAAAAALKPARAVASAASSSSASSCNLPPVVGLMLPAATGARMAAAAASSVSGIHRDVRPVSPSAAFTWPSSKDQALPPHLRSLLASSKIHVINGSSSSSNEAAGKWGGTFPSTLARGAASPLLSGAAPLGIGSRVHPSTRRFFSSTPRARYSDIPHTTAASAKAIASSTAVNADLADTGAPALSSLENPEITGTVLRDLPFHNVERLQGIWNDESIPEVMHHLADVWSSVAMEKSIMALHEASGMPWWATLVCATLVMRAATLPFNIILMRNQLRLKLVRRRMEELTVEMETAPDEETRVAAAKTVDKLFREHKCHPVFSWDWLIPVMLPPVFLSYFFSIHNLCIGEGTMATGGTLWFTDLMAPDATSFLPIVSGITWLAVCEASAGQLYLTSPRLKFWTRMASIALISLTSALPVGVFCFWITSNLWEITRLRIMREDAVRDLLGIPRLSLLPPIQPSAW